MEQVEVDDVFKSMVEAPEPGRGTYINEDGSFLVEIVKAFGKAGFKGKSFIVEFKVLESNNESVPVGCTRSWTVKWDKVINHADMKAFSLAATNLRKLVENKREADAQATYLVYAAAGPLVAGEASTKAKKLLKAEDGFFDGLKVRLDTEKTTTTAGTPFTRYKWSPV